MRIYLTTLFLVLGLSSCRGKGLPESQVLSEVLYRDADNVFWLTAPVNVQDWMTISEISLADYEQAKKNVYQSYVPLTIELLRGELEVKCESGSIRLESMYGDGDEGGSYLGYTQALGGMHLIRHASPEGGCYQYYSMKTGQEMLGCSGEDITLISPDGKHAIYVGYDDETYSIPYISLYDLSAGRFERIFYAPFKNWTRGRADSFWDTEGAFYCSYRFINSDTEGYMKITLRDK